MQWLNTSYSMWFNRRHERVGPLLQGRYKGVWIENSGWAYEASMYVHLNPLRIKAHGLDKRSRSLAGAGRFDMPPSKEEVTWGGIGVRSSLLIPSKNPLFSE